MWKKCKKTPHLPWPLDIMVEPKGDEYELQKVDGEVELEFDGPIVLDAPNAGRNGHEADDDKWSEDAKPRVPLRLQVIGEQQLEEKQKEVESEGYKEGPVLYRGLPL